MKKVGNHISIFRISLLSFVFLFQFSLRTYAQDAVPAATEAPVAEASVAGAGDPVKGKALFNSNCAACHKLDAKSTGPALRGVAQKHDMEWIYKWVHNSSDMVKSGDPAAVAIFTEYKGSVMTNFPQLSNKDIDDIIAYTSEEKKAPAAALGSAAPPGTETAAQGGISNNMILGALIIVMAILVVMLVMVNRVLNRIASAKGIELPVKERGLPLWKAFAKNQFLVFVTSVFMILAAGYFLYGYLMQVGVDQNYMPIQPIHYSHKIHAGDNEIDCKYCHSAARVSKTAGIPSLNVCMNCHKNISEVAETTATAEHSKAFYDAEIQKLYDAVGWDKAAQAYTGKTKPVKWIRIHNLPDFAYFNHSQHVTVAGLECQQCHGPVEEYEVMKQFAPLTMGWCVDCHRKTDVKIKDNGYYTKIHEELSKKYGVEKLTAAQMGGLECGKCHY